MCDDANCHLENKQTFCLLFIYRKLTFRYLSYIMYLLPEILFTVLNQAEEFMSH